MPSYNFQEQFADDVATGRKPQTIRAKRKYPPRVGQTAYCFCGMRTKKCRRLGAWQIKGVFDVCIDTAGVIINGSVLLDKHLDTFAFKDGFKNWATMLAWFTKTHGLPFRGDLVMWHNINPRGSK